MNEAEAFILIGGRSSRMGRDKALVEVDGVSFARRALETLRSVEFFSKVTFVAANQAQFVIPAVALGAPFIFDIYPGRGPLSGLHAGLAESASEWIFVMACDYPFASKEMIEVLASRLADEYSVVLPEQRDGRLQPLFGFYRTLPTRAIVNDIVERQKAAPPMRELVEQLNSRIVRFDEYGHLAGAERIFHNVNTPGDLADAAVMPSRRDRVK
jgi:molybdopterin-guanine dinucleotide biosynthesis protein A